MKEIIIVLIIFILGINPLLAQKIEEESIRKNEIVLRAGAASGYFKDLNFSPLNYSGNSFALNLDYQRKIRNNNLLLISSNVQFGGLNSDISEFNNSDHYNLNVELNYFFKIPFRSSNTLVYLGGNYHSYLNLVFYDGTESISFYGLHSIGISARISRKISARHGVNGNLSLPVFGLLVRPPHTGWDKFIVEHADNPLPVFFLVVKKYL